AVEQQVMEAPGKLIAGLAQPEQAQAQQRRLGQIEAALALGLEVYHYLGSLRRRLDAAQIVQLQRHMNLSMHHLHRLVEILPGKRRAENRRVRDHQLPCALEGRDIELTLQGTK